MASLVRTCRNRATGPRRHHCSDYHQDLVESYRLARYAQEQRAEDYAKGWPEEEAAFYRDVERPLLFRDWLQDFPSRRAAGGPETGNLAA